MELPHQGLILQVPHGNVTVGAAGEAHFRVGRDGQRVAGRRIRGQFGLDARCGTSEIPDGQVGRFTTNDQRPTIGQKLHRADVVVPLLQIGKQKRELACFTVGFRNKITKRTRQSNCETGFLLPGWEMSHALTQPLPPVYTYLVGFEIVTAHTTSPWLRELI